MLSFLGEAEFSVDAREEAVRVFERVTDFGGLADCDAERLGDLDASEDVDVGIGGGDPRCDGARFVHAGGWNGVEANLP